MPKHRRRRKAAKAAKNRLVDPKEQGLQAFRQGDYTKAIDQWRKLRAQGESAVCAALAEAYFRRGLGRRHQRSEAVADLRRTVELIPDEARYWYHLGLALHRADRVEEARTAYVRAAELGYQGRGFGFVRGLAEIEYAPHLSLDELPWLSPADRITLTPIAALVRGEPQAVLTSAPGNWLERFKALGRTGASVALWQGLACLSGGAADQALDKLTLPKGQQLREGAEQVRAFYCGLAGVAAAGDSQVALDAWTEVSRSSAQAAFPFLPRLRQGMVQLQGQRLHELQKAGQWAAAFGQAQTALTILPAEPVLLQSSLNAAQHLAGAAIEAGDWAAALTHWQAMRGILEQYPGLGPLPPVLRNLAIACETLEQWEAAAEAWAALLDTFPKRSSKKTEDEQCAWLRLRVVENYKRGGRPDQSIVYCKQAVKAAPDNLDLRLELASALLGNDQTIAARNELKRILSKDAGHLEAYLLLAEVHQDRDEWPAAEQALRRVVEMDPGREVARRGIAQMMESRGVDEFNSGRPKQARNTYREAVEFSPTNTHLRILLADTELVLKDADAARVHLEEILASGQDQAYVEVFGCWVKHQNESEARQVLRRAEEVGVGEPQLYIDMGVVCLTQGVPLLPEPSFFGPQFRQVKKETKWERWGRELIQQGLADVPAQALDEVLGHVVVAIALQHPAIAVEYTRQRVELQPEDPKVLLDLGLLQALSWENAAAKDTLHRAERLARGQGQKELARDIAAKRRQVGDPLSGLVGSLLAQFGPDFEFDEEEF